MNLLPRSQQGSLTLAPTVYGRSVLGAPLEVWRPAGDCRILVFAGIHGEEGETTAALSKALRHLGERFGLLGVIVVPMSAGFDDAKHILADLVDEVLPLLEPFRTMEDDRDFWNHTLDGLAVLAANEFGSHASGSVRLTLPRG